MLPVACRLLRVVLAFVVCCLLDVVDFICLLLTSVRCLLFGVFCVLFGVYAS